eukprot:TRINITY_DN3128_c0_g1_i1.p1 TRINITY_DN3128_c0_g1~~TRINITY_DN3128_c0_g1_i1.p1  ORF type:complete len:119 (+),score=29.08 TRINITY_DN3128_c0_g1_i1:39-395(+)
MASAPQEPNSNVPNVGNNDGKTWRMPNLPPQLRKASFKDMWRNDPLIIIGTGLTAVILCGGLYSMFSGKQKLSQSFMRARVIAQGATVALIIGSAYWKGLPALKQKQDEERKRQMEMK